MLLENIIKPPAPIFDTHAHYDDEAFDGIREELFKEMAEKGVGMIINNATDLECSAEKCLEMAMQYVDLGLYIGVGGVATFKNARKLVEVCEAVPLDRILLETDAPYLAPEPFRGNLCTSSHIYYTAAKIAEIKGVSLEQVLTVTFKNAEQLYLNR